MAVLGVFVGMLYGWLTVGFIWPSILGLVFLGVTGISTINEALTAGWGNINAVIYVILGFMFAAYIESSGLADGISSFFLTRKFLIGHPWYLIIIIFMCAWALGALAGVFAGIFVSWAILYSMLERLGYEKRSKVSAYILSTAVFGAVAGLVFLPFHATALLYVNFMTSAVGVTIGFGPYMIYQFVMTIVLAVAWAGFGRFILQLDLAAIATAGDQFAYLRGVKYTFEQKFAFAMLLLTIGIMIAPEFLPDGSSSETLFETLGIAGAFIIGMVIPAIVKNKEGKPLINLAECTQKCSWDVIWLLVATMPVAAAMQSADTGIVSTIVTFVMSAIGNMNWIMFTVLCAVILGALTQITHNLIIAIVLFGPLCQVCVNLGGNPVIWFMVNYWMNMCAFVTPAASANSAIMHGNTEWIKAGDAYYMGTAYFVVNIIFVTMVAFTLGNVLF